MAGHNRVRGHSSLVVAQGAFENLKIRAADPDVGHADQHLAGLQLGTVRFSMRARCGP